MNRVLPVTVPVTAEMKARTGARLRAEARRARAKMKTMRVISALVYCKIAAHKGMKPKDMKAAVVRRLNLKLREVKRMDRLTGLTGGRSRRR